MKIRNLFKARTAENNGFPQRIRISTDNINQWPLYEKLLTEAKIKFDRKGRLRYLHGAPVGDLTLSGIGNDGKPVYRESADEWFDPQSNKAFGFEWP